MGVWGEKCVRCGEKRTKSTYEGLPTCDACRDALQAKLKADAEDPRSCPLDATPMAKEIVLNVVLDRCPTCKGMWLDGGELDVLKAGIEAGMAADLGHALFVPPF